MNLFRKIIQSRSKKDEIFFAEIQKIVGFKPNDFTTPLYLLKAGKTALELNEFKKATGFFTKIKDKYSKSDEALDIDMYINKAAHQK